MICTWIPVGLAEERLDASFYEPKYLAVTERIEAAAAHTTFEILRKSNRPITYGVLKPELDKQGVPLIRNQNFEAPSVNSAGVVRITREQELMYKRSRTTPGDLLVTLGGYVGTAAIVPPSLEDANINQHIARVSIDEAKADAYFYWAFVASPSGGLLLQRWVSGTVQPGINLGDLRLIRLPYPPREIQRAVGNHVRKAERLSELARDAQDAFNSWISEVVAFDQMSLSLQSSLKESPDDCATDFTWVANRDITERIDPWPHHIAPRTLKAHLARRENSKSFSDFLQVVTSSRSRLQIQGANKDQYHISVLDVDCNGHIDWHSAETHRYDGPGTIINPGDLLFSCLNPKETRVCVIPQNIKGAVVASPEFAVLNLRSEIRTPFLLAAILRSNFLRVQTSFLTRSSSLSRRRLHEDDLTFLRLPWWKQNSLQLETKLALAIDAQVEAGALLRKSIALVESLLDATLDKKALLAESAAIEQWLQTHPSPYASK